MMLIRLHTTHLFAKVAKNSKKNQEKEIRENGKRASNLAKISYIVCRERQAIN